MSEIYKCLCQKNYNEKEFISHTQICKAFKIKFEKFDTKLSLLIKSYSDTEENLRFIKFLLKRFIKLINSKLNYNQENNEQPKFKSALLNKNKYNISSKLLISITYNPIERDLSNEFIVLKSLSSLDCINNWFKKSNINQFKDKTKSVTKEFYKVLDIIYNGPNERPSDLLYLIYTYEYKLKSMNKNIENNPYNFLNDFLELLHIENNIIKNRNMNMYYLRNITNPEIKQNEDELYKQYQQDYSNRLNSFISECFFNIIRIQTKCENNCPPTFDFDYEKIFIIEMDKYKSSNKKVNLINCLLDYINDGHKIQCNNCKSYAKEYKKFYNPVKVLIIYFKRKTSIYTNDVLFNKDLKLYPFISMKRKDKIDFFPYYTLKACISYNKQNQYFTDIFINKNWHRFIGENSLHLNDMNDVLVNVPKILIYELEENNNLYQNLNQNFTLMMSNSLNNMNLNSINILPEQQNNLLMNNNFNNNIPMTNSFNNNIPMTNSFNNNNIPMTNSFSNNDLSMNNSFNNNNILMNNNLNNNNIPMTNSFSNNNLSMNNSFNNNNLSMNNNFNNNNLSMNNNFNNNIPMTNSFSNNNLSMNNNFSNNNINDNNSNFNNNLNNNYNFNNSYNL